MENTTSVLLPKNVTLDESKDRIVEAFRVISATVFAIIMFGMGCAVDHRKLVENLKRPVGLIVGLSCQILFMPSLAYALIKIFGMSSIHAIAFMLVGCSPGGSGSNLMTYLARGDISLSVAMTSFSNLLALGTVPVWVVVFTTLEKIDKSLQIPYWSLGVGLLTIIIPVAVGIAFRYKFEKKARPIPRICAIFGIIMLIGTVTGMVVLANMPVIFTATTFPPIGLLPIVGMVVAYLITCIPQLKLSIGARKAIAIETAIQNSGLSGSVLVLSYGDRLELIGHALTIPILYGVAQVFYAMLFIGTYRIWLCCKSSRDVVEEDVEEVATHSDNMKENKEKEPLNPESDCEKN